MPFIKKTKWRGKRNAQIINMHWWDTLSFVLFARLRQGYGAALNFQSLANASVKIGGAELLEQKNRPNGRYFFIF